MLSRKEGGGRQRFIRTWARRDLIGNARRRFGRGGRKKESAILQRNTHVLFKIIFQKKERYKPIGGKKGVFRRLSGRTLRTTWGCSLERFERREVVDTRSCRGKKGEDTRRVERGVCWKERIVEKSSAPDRGGISPRMKGGCVLFKTKRESLS